MGVESSTRHDENISQTAKADSLTKKPMNIGIDTPIPWLTMRTFVMGAFVSIGGLLYGYDTGQIAGFQEMSNHLERYGELQSDGSYAFSTIRSGLIVSMLSIGTLIGVLCDAPLADWFGRKWSISFWCFILNVGLIVQISTPADGGWRCGL